MQPSQSGPLRLLFMSALILHLSGCADPFQLMLYGISSATMPTDQELIADHEASYYQFGNDFTCEQLQYQHDEYQEKVKVRGNDQPNVLYLGYYRAIGNLQIRKGCATETSVAGATASPQPGANTGSVSNETRTQQLGLSTEPLSADLVKALGLKSNAGVWVVAVAPASAADKAGLKAMDVIVEVSGQAVTDTASLQAIVGNMRSGYKAPVRVWRDHAFKDLTVEMAVRPVPSVAEAQPPRQDAVKSVTPSAAIAPAVATPRIEFCYVRMSQWGSGSHPNVFSEVFQDPHVSDTPQSMIAVTRRYAETVSAQQPGIWSNFDYLPNQCVPSAGDCYAAINSWFTTNQAVHLYCRYSRAEAEDELAVAKRPYPTATTINMH